MAKQPGHFYELEEALANRDHARSLEFVGDDWLLPDLVVPPEIGQLRNLEELVIWEYDEVELPPELGELKKLKKFVLICRNREFPWEILNSWELEELQLWLSQWAVPKEIAKLRKLRSVNLHDVVSLCPEFGLLGNLRRLRCYGRTLRSLPDELENLWRLEHLDIAGGAFPNFPKLVCRLESLKYLSISNTFIDELPIEIAYLKNLRELKFSKPPEHHDRGKYQARVLQIRQAWCELRELRKLNLSGQRILDCSDNVRNWTKLEELNLNSNDMEAIPPELFQITSLKTVHLNFNRLAEIPSDIANWSELESLHLNRSPLKSLPKEIEHLKNLKYLDIRNTAVSEAVCESLREQLPETEIEW